MLVDAGRAPVAPAVAARSTDLNPYDDVSFPLGVTRRGDPVKAYVTIIEGCNEFCSFCVVPYTRGHERMRPKADILAEVREAAATGRREVQLLGQIVNHYQAPDDPVVRLRRRCSKRSTTSTGIERIRFASPHPRHVTPRLLAAMRDLPKVCRHLHLPVQSGSTRVLEAMRRRYTREELPRPRRRDPRAAAGRGALDRYDRRLPRRDGRRLRGDAVADGGGPVSQHVLVQVFAAAEHAGRRSGMPDDVPEDEKTRRIVALQALQRDDPDRAERSGSVGHDVEVLVDAASRRRDDGAVGPDDAATRSSTCRGRATGSASMVRVRIERAGPHSVWGAAAGARR